MYTEINFQYSFSRGRKEKEVSWDAKELVT